MFVLLNFLAAQTFVFFNPCFQLPNNQKIAPKVMLPQHHEHSCMEWALTDFLKQKDNPASIVLLGSSLVMVPINSADANLTQRIIDSALHHKSILLSLLIHSLNHLVVSNFNFALPGMMPSDAYLITKLLLGDKDHPELIIYGIGPRDFIDNLFTVPSTTDTYFYLHKQLARQYGQQSLLPYVGQGLQSRLNYLLEQQFAVCQNKEEISNTFYFQLDRVFRSIASDSGSSLYRKDFSIPQIEKSTISNGLYSKELDHYLFFPPNKIGWGPNHFQKNLDEYRSRYRHFNIDTFTSQTKFFLDFLQLAAKNKSKVLIVAMPITSANRELIPKYVFSIYKENLRVLSKQFGAGFLDLDSSSCFCDKDFSDTVHLNTIGGNKFVKLIADYVVQNKLIEPHPFVINKLSNSQPIDLSSSDEELKTVGKIASWWVAKSYFAQPTPPDIVVLGNSQLGAVQGADTSVFKDRPTIDATGDHRSRLLEHDLKVLLNQRWRTLIAGLPEAMVSDQLVFSRAIFSEKYHPKAVVITLSPRDFIDNTCYSVTSSEVFTFFAKYAHLGSDLDLFLSDQKVYTKQRPILPVSLKTNSSLPMESYSVQLGENDFSEIFSPLRLNKQFQRIRPGEIIVNSSTGYVFRDNTEEYKRRYKRPDSPRFKMQLHCLESLLSYLKQLHIKVVVIGMPLMKENKELLPKNFWKLYNQQISEICHKNGVDWLDIDTVWNTFSKKDFLDTAHLNLSGGRQLTRPIAVGLAHAFGFVMANGSEQRDGQGMF